MGIHVWVNKKEKTKHICFPKLRKSIPKLTKSGNVLERKCECLKETKYNLQLKLLI